MFQRRYQPGGYGDGGRNDYHHYHQVERDGVSRLYLVHDDFAGVERPAEVETYRAPQPAAVLDVQGVVEAQLVPQLLDHLLGAFLVHLRAHNRRGHVAGHHAHDEKHQRHGAKERGYGEYDPAEQVFLHDSPNSAKLE